MSLFEPEVGELFTCLRDPPGYEERADFIGLVFAVAELFYCPDTEDYQIFLLATDATIPEKDPRKHIWIFHSDFKWFFNEYYEIP